MMPFGIGKGLGLRGATVGLIASAIGVKAENELEIIPGNLEVPGEEKHSALIMVLCCLVSWCAIVGLAVQIRWLVKILTYVRRRLCALEETDDYPPTDQGPAEIVDVAVAIALVHRDLLRGQDVDRVLARPPR